jgi:hypothetical protein
MDRLCDRAPDDRAHQRVELRIGQSGASVAQACLFERLERGFDRGAGELR